MPMQTNLLGNFYTHPSLKTIGLWLVGEVSYLWETQECPPRPLPFCTCLNNCSCYGFLQQVSCRSQWIVSLERCHLCRQVFLGMHSKELHEGSMLAWQHVASPSYWCPHFFVATQARTPPYSFWGSLRRGWVVLGIALWSPPTPSGNVWIQVLKRNLAKGVLSNLVSITAPNSVYTYTYHGCVTLDTSPHHFVSPSLFVKCSENNILHLSQLKEKHMQNHPAHSK